LVDAAGRVIAGNKTVQAAAALGLPIQVVDSDGESLVVVRRRDLDLSEQGGRARKLAFADNRTAELGLDWDASRIAAAAEADALPAGMWQEEEIASLVAALEPDTLPDDGGPLGENGFEYTQTWAVTVICDSAEHQEQVYDQLTAAGYRCRVVVV
jgi:hypothetical protein